MAWNFTMSPSKLTDWYGFWVENTPMWEQRITEITRLVGTTFEWATVDTNFWTVTNTGTGSAASQANWVATVTSGTANSGNGSFITTRYARYTGGSAMRFRAQIYLDNTWVANNTRNWGCYDTNNGAFFQLTWTTVNIVTRNATADTVVASTAWNGNQTVPTLTNMQTYEIYYTNKKVYFVINDVIVHTVTATTAVWSASKNFTVKFESYNSAWGTLSGSINVASANISRLGKLETNKQSKYQSTVTGSVYKRWAGQLHSLVIGAVPTSGAVITLYDNVAASGTILASFTCIFPGGGNFNPISVDFKWLPFNTWLYVDCITQAASITTIYE